MPFMNLKSTGYFCTTANRWQHAKQNGHVRMYAPLFPLPRALHANEIARFRMDTNWQSSAAVSALLPTIVCAPADD
jgi:hypothetical protein